MQMRRSAWLVVAGLAMVACGGTAVTAPTSRPLFGDAPPVESAGAELPPPPELPAAEPADSGQPPQLLLRPLDAGEINRVIRSRVLALRACYDEARLLDPELGAGEASMMWRIERGGSVSWAVMKSREFRSPRLALCLTTVVRGMLFRGSSSGNVVDYPFRFEPPADE